jgi:hypothetical protein
MALQRCPGHQRNICTHKIFVHLIGLFFEWELISWMDEVEKRHYNLVWEKFNDARMILTSCHAVFNGLRRICDLAMTRERDQEAPTCPRTDYVRI